MLATVLQFGSVVGFLCTCEVGEEVYQAISGTPMAKRGLGNAISAFFSPLPLQSHCPSLSARGQAAERSRDLMRVAFPTDIPDSLQEKGWKGHALAPAPTLLSKKGCACIREGPWKRQCCFAPHLGVTAQIHQST